MKLLRAAILIGGLSAISSLHAQEPAKPEATSEQAAPEKDLTGWQWANFLVLAAGIGYLAVKMGSPYFRQQSKQITRGLEEARQQRIQAEIRSQEVTRKLDNLGSDIDSLRQNVLQEQAFQSERMQERAELELQRVHSNAAQQTEIAGKQARIELQRYASKLAVELAEQRVRARMTPDVQRALASQFVESLRAS